MIKRKKHVAVLTALLAVLLLLPACSVWPSDGSSSSSTTIDLSNALSNPSDLITEPTTESTSSDTDEPGNSSGSDIASPTPMPSDWWTAAIAAVDVPATAHVAVADGSGLWSRWPSVLTTPYQMTFDFSTYTGRDKTETALQGLTVILDPGHGGRDPGAIADHNGVTILEKDINLAIALQTRTKLEALGATVIMTRTDDSWVSLYQRIAIAGLETIDFWDRSLKDANLDSSWLTAVKPAMQDLIDVNDDTVESGGRGIAQGMGVVPELRLLMDAQVQTHNIIFVSVHANSTDTSVEDKRGLQMYISTNQHIFESEGSMIAANPNDPEITPINPNYTAYDDAARMKLANALFNEITVQVPALKQSEITAYAGNFAFLREHNLTSVLVETGFMSNAQDLAILLDGPSQSAIAEGIANGVWQYFTR